LRLRISTRKYCKLYVGESGAYGNNMEVIVIRKMYTLSIIEDLCLLGYNAL
jgi:hypothetical protein